MFYRSPLETIAYCYLPESVEIDSHRNTFLTPTWRKHSLLSQGAARKERHKCSGRRASSSFFVFDLCTLFRTTFLNADRNYSKSQILLLVIYLLSVFLSRASCVIGDEVTDLLHLQYEYRVLVPYVPSTVVDTVNLSQIEVRGATVSFFFSRPKSRIHPNTKNLKS